jgi:hypothetical protein
MLYLVSLVRLIIKVTVQNVDESLSVTERIPGRLLVSPNT